MGVRHEITDYTPEDLKHLASRLRFYADKYDSVVKSMAEIEVVALGLPNEKSLTLAMESLRRHVAETETALSRLLDTPPSRLVAENAEFFAVKVGKGKRTPPAPPSDSGQSKKRAE